MTSTSAKPSRASRAAEPSAVPPVAAAPSAVRVVLPVGARPGLLRMGTYVPGVVYAVTPESAVRLQGRGFQIADDVTDTADSATADGGVAGTNSQES